LKKSFSNICLVAAFFCCSATAKPLHSCTGVEFFTDTVSPGITTLSTCYDGAFCLLDTFSEKGLLDFLVSQYNKHDFAFLGTIDSIPHERYIDTLYYADTFAIDAQEREVIRIVVTTPLKGVLPTQFTFSETWSAHYLDSAHTDSISYRPVAGRKVLLFYSDTATLWNMQLLPSQECLYMATGNFADNDTLTREGLSRVEGIGIPLRRFLDRVAVENPPQRVGNKGHFRISPNPARIGQRVSLNYLPEVEKRKKPFNPITFSVFNIRGELVHIVKGSIKNGKNGRAFWLPRRSLNGIFVVVGNYGNRKYSKKLVIIK